MPNAQFLGALEELRGQGMPQDRIDDLKRQYRSANSPLEQTSEAIFGTGLNTAAANARQEAEAGGRRSIIGGMFTKDAGTTGMDALASMRPSLTAGLLGALQGGGQAVDAPWAAANNLMPQGDMALEALGTAGAAMTGGGAAVVPDGSLRAGFARKARMNPQGRIDDYAGNHTAPIRDGYSAPLSNLAGDIYPDDIYSPQAAQYYGQGDRRLDEASARILRRYRNKPDAEVPIYRAAPLDAEDINAGDWITLNREYARQHGDAYLDTDYNILEGRAKAGDLFTDGNSMHEFGWSPIVNANANTSGGLLATAASDALTPSQQMARRILDMRAAGRAGEVTDDMMAQADPQVMFNETPLDMSVGARMQRAEDMGADPLTQFYHGTAKGGFVDTTDIQAFDPSRVGDRWNADDRGFSMTSSPQDANYYAKPSDPGYGPDGIKNDNLRGGMVYPLEDLSQRPYNIKPMDDFEGTIGAWDNRPDNTYDLMDAAGADSARIYSDGVEMRVVMDPSNIRSRFARFDPEFAHLSNLSAANASPTAGALASIGEDDTEAKKRDIVRKLMPSAQNIIRRQ